MRKKLISLLLVLAMLLSFAVPVLADGTEGGTPTALDVSTGDVAITENGSYVITGSTTKNHVTVAENVEATITLNGVSIQLSDGSGVSGGNSTDMSGAGTAAIALGAGSKVTLILQGENTLQSGAGRAAIEVPGSKIHVDGKPTAATPASLTIQGTGTLNATGGNSAAGIGGSFCMNAGSITIAGGTINATAGGGSNGDSGAGIGGGHAGDKVGKAYGSFDRITITGGVINADGVRLGAGIGAGAHGKCDDATITITGGVITANGGTYRGDGGDGIGLAHGGSNNTPPAVTISNNAVVTASSINAKNSSKQEARTTISGGIVINGSAGTMYGDVTLTDSFEVPSKVTLTVPEGKTLSVPVNTVLTVTGMINGAGTVRVTGGGVVNHDNITCTYVPGDYVLTLAANPASQTYNQSITLTATLAKFDAENTAIADPSGISGTVTFTCGDETLGTAALTDGTATLTTQAKWPAGDHTVKAVVTVDGTPVSGKTTVTVTKAAQTTPPAAPTAKEDGVSYGTITLNAVTTTGYGDVQYAYVEKPAEGEAAAPSNWQNSTELTGLKAGTTYLVYARYAGNDCYEPSAASAATEITTAAMTPMAAPALSNAGNTIGYKTVTLKAPGASTDYEEATVQYRVRKNSDEEWGDWQDSADFTGLTPETTYRFQARYAIKAYEHYSPASEDITLTTMAIPKINVSLRVIGASKPSGNPTFSRTSYDYKGAEYQNWMKTTSYTVDAETTAKTLIDTVLKEKSFTYTLADTYSGTSVTAPTEFGSHALGSGSWGSNSRWYITVKNNGNLVEEASSFNSYELQDGDQVIFHYVFDYRYETSRGTFSNRHREIVQKYLKVIDLTTEELRAVNTVIDLINAIGRVTPESGDAIEAANDAYNALSDAQKALVTNHMTLIDAIATYEEITKDTDGNTQLSTPVLSVKECGLYSVQLEVATRSDNEEYYSTVVYSASLDGINWGAWQTSAVFDKLLPAETYYFRAMAQTNDWTTYGDSAVSASVTATTKGGVAGEYTIVEVDNADQLATALGSAATDGTLTVVDFTENIVINDIKQQNYTATIPAGANILLTSSKGKGFFFNECGGGSCIQVTAGTTVTVRDMTLSSLSHQLVKDPDGTYGSGNTPGNAWHSALRIMDSSATVNLDNVTMYNDSTSRGVVQSVQPGTVNIYSGSYRGLGYDVFDMQSGSTVNLIPMGDIMIDGTASIPNAMTLNPMLGVPVSGAAKASESGSYAALSAAQLSAGSSLTYGYGLRVNMDSTTVVPPAALANPVVKEKNTEGADTADVVYEREDDKIIFTVNRYGKDNNALIRFYQKSFQHWRSFADVTSDDKTGLGNTFTYSGLTQDTEYEFRIQYASLDGSYTDSETVITIKTTYTAAKLDAPAALSDDLTKTADSITLVPPAASTQDTTAVVQYRMATSEAGLESAEWTTNPAFTDLQPGTTYYFQARYVAQHHLWLDSDPGPVLEVRTKVSNKQLRGDVNDDGAVGEQDVTSLRRYLAKWDEKVNVQKADVNADGNVNLLDLIYLRRYLNFWPDYMTIPGM